MQEEEDSAASVTPDEQRSVEDEEQVVFAVQKEGASEGAEEASSAGGQWEVPPFPHGGSGFSLVMRDPPRRLKKLDYGGTTKWKVVESTAYFELHHYAWGPLANLRKGLGYPDSRRYRVCSTNFGGCFELVAAHREEDAEWAWKAFFEPLSERLGPPEAWLDASMFWQSMTPLLKMYKVSMAQRLQERLSLAQSQQGDVRTALTSAEEEAEVWLVSMLNGWVMSKDVIEYVKEDTSEPKTGAEDAQETDVVVEAQEDDNIGAQEGGVGSQGTEVREPESDRAGCELGSAITAAPATKKEMRKQRKEEKKRAKRSQKGTKKQKKKLKKKGKGGMREPSLWSANKVPVCVCCHRPPREPVFVGPTGPELIRLAEGSLGCRTCVLRRLELRDMSTRGEVNAKKYRGSPIARGVIVPLTSDQLSCATYWSTVTCVSSVLNRAVMMPEELAVWLEEHPACEWLGNRPDALTHLEECPAWKGEWPCPNVMFGCNDTFDTALDAMAHSMALCSVTHDQRVAARAHASAPGDGTAEEEEPELVGVWDLIPADIVRVVAVYLNPMEVGALSCCNKQLNVALKDMAKLPLCTLCRRRHRKPYMVHLGRFRGNNLRRAGASAARGAVTAGAATLGFMPYFVGGFGYGFAKGFASSILYGFAIPFISTMESHNIAAAIGMGLLTAPLGIIASPFVGLFYAFKHVGKSMKKLRRKAVRAGQRSTPWSGWSCCGAYQLHARGCASCSRDMDEMMRHEQDLEQRLAEQHLMFHRDAPNPAQYFPQGGVGAGHVAPRVDNAEDDAIAIALAASVEQAAGGGGGAQWEGMPQWMVEEGRREAERLERLAAGATVAADDGAWQAIPPEWLEPGAEDPAMWANAVAEPWVPHMEDGPNA